MHIRTHHEFHVPAWLAKLGHAALLALVALLVLALPRALAQERLGGDPIVVIPA